MLTELGVWVCEWVLVDLWTPDSGLSEGGYCESGLSEQD